MRSLDILRASKDSTWAEIEIEPKINHNIYSYNSNMDVKISHTMVFKSD